MAQRNTPLESKHTRLCRTLNQNAHDTSISGFVAHLENGDKVHEKLNYTNNEGVKKATNWSEVPKDDIIALEMVMRGMTILVLTKEELSPDEWHFTHTGASSMSDLKGGKDTEIISRNIGYTKEGITRMYDVSEKHRGIVYREKKAS